MKRMNRADVREWRVGEPVSRVRLDDGITGIDKDMPSDMSDHGLKKLLWRCAVSKADTGLDITIEPYVESDFSIGARFYVIINGSNTGPYFFDDAWFYIEAVERGYRIFLHAGFDSAASDRFHRHLRHVCPPPCDDNIKSSNCHIVDSFRRLKRLLYRRIKTKTFRV